MRFLILLFFLLSLSLQAEKITGYVDSVRGEMKLGSLTYYSFGDGKSGASMIFADNKNGIRKKFMKLFNKTKKRKKKLLFCFEGKKIKYRGKTIALVNSPVSFKEVGGKVGKVKPFKSKTVFKFGHVKSEAEQRADRSERAKEMIRKNKERNGIK